MIHVDLCRCMKYNYHNCRIKHNSAALRIMLAELLPVGRPRKGEENGSGTYAGTNHSGTGSGKEITIAHLSQVRTLHCMKNSGLIRGLKHSKSAIGRAYDQSGKRQQIYAGDIATRRRGLSLDLWDRFSGTLIVTGTISET